MNVGDVVVLNSGGPDMTIIFFSNGVATCQWDGDQTGEFKVECLTLKQ